MPRKNSKSHATALIRLTGGYEQLARSFEAGGDERGTASVNSVRIFGHSNV